MLREAELADELRRELKLRPDTARVVSRESTQLEFKESLNLGSLARYLRTMAAFANTRGGFLVFGVRDSPRDLVGVDRDRFDRLETERLTEHINTCFSPAFDWSVGEIELEGYQLGFLYTYLHHRRPVICIRSSDSILRDGDIYYRYRGQTRRIREPELSAIFEERLEREREAWRRQIAHIAEAGPADVAVLDLVTGQAGGTGGSYLVPDDIIDRLKVVREGRFSESSGAPTLRLIGEAQPVGVVGTTQEVPISAHFHDLVRHFLSGSQLSEAAAQAYLDTVFRQVSFYLPIHFFLRQSGLSKTEAVDRLNELPGTQFRAEKRARIQGQRQVSPQGAIAKQLPIFDALRTDLLAEYRELETQKERRSLLLAGLLTAPSAIESVVQDLEPARLAEAVTHLPRSELKRSETAIRRTLSRKFDEGFDDWEGSARTAFRKAIAHLDEELYSDDD